MCVEQCAGCKVWMDPSDMARGPRIKEGPHAGLYEKANPPMCDDCYDKVKGKKK